MGSLVVRQKIDGTTVKEWEAEAVRDADGNIVWVDERNSIAEMDTAPTGVLD
tara:strand:+ start:14639 stop:14794 length:156 start_codon:yes stop_codon:yes gene_type:complete